MSYTPPRAQVLSSHILYSRGAVLCSRCPYNPLSAHKRYARARSPRSRDDDDDDDDYRSNDEERREKEFVLRVVSRGAGVQERAGRGRHRAGDLGAGGAREEGDAVQVHAAGQPPGPEDRAQRVGAELAAGRQELQERPGQAPDPRPRGHVRATGRGPRGRGPAAVQPGHQVAGARARVPLRQRGDGHAAVRPAADAGGPAGEPEEAQRDGVQAAADDPVRRRGASAAAAAPAGQGREDGRRGRGRGRQKGLAAVVVVRKRRRARRRAHDHVVRLAGGRAQEETGHRRQDRRRPHTAAAQGLRHRAPAPGQPQRHRLQTVHEHQHRGRERRETGLRPAVRRHEDGIERRVERHRVRSRAQPGTVRAGKPIRGQQLVFRYTHRRAIEIFRFLYRDDVDIIWINGCDDCTCTTHVARAIRGNRYTCCV